MSSKENKLKVKRLIKKMVSWAGIFFFALAAYMIYLQLSKYELDDIKNALLSIPTHNLILACVASFLGYVALSVYDFLAITYIKRKLEPWKWILAGFVGFSISNNAGHAIISGGSVRYRFYTRWRFQGTEIIRMVTFSGFTYLWACFFLIILGYILTPDHAFGDGSVSKFTTTATAIVAAVGLTIYFSAVIFYKKPIFIKGVEFSMPSLKMALAQVFIGGADILLASLVLYFVLTPFVEIPFQTFIGVYLIAQVLGVFSQVPGGLGIFESLFLYIIPGDHNQAVLFGALIAYRIIYYLLPLVVSAFLLIFYERHLSVLKAKIIAKRDNLMQKIKDKDIKLHRKKES
ncbi:MAG: hypothetical protein PHE89_07195 [Alphaproteobacteria bacterium]|nr:hypothetical protein [Alphaproteobacteria bacterium]